MFPCLAFILYINPGGENDFLYSLIDKKKRAESITGEKIIFGGGSSAVFGINSQRIEDDLRIPVVNMGLHAGLGLTFPLNELESVSNKGDVIVLCIEYFLSDRDVNNSLIQEIKRFYPISKKVDLKNKIVSSLDPIKYFLLKYLLIIQKNVKYFDVQIESIYKRKNFNSHGDLVGINDLESLPYDKLGSRTRLEWEDYSSEVKKLNEFSQRMKVRGIQVLHIYPPYAKTEFEKNHQVIEKLDRFLRENIEFKMLINPDDSVFDDTLFYDTVYHLNNLGREKNTEQILSKLKPYF